MAITHLRDGEDFAPEHFSKEFGFKGSAERAPAHHETGTQVGPMPPAVEPSAAGARMAEGGHVHPHGHHVVHVEARRDGSVVHHHSHGGHTIHHSDGHVTHHGSGGEHLAHGGSEHLAHGGMAEHEHPHGHEVVRRERRHDGAEIEHHAHGGHTVHHPDGRVTHHTHDGAPVRHHAEGVFGAAHGGHVGTHPHGHHVVREEHRADGGVIHHHAHGGMTLHHPDGRITHHGADGDEAYRGGGEFHQRHPDDADEDRTLVTKGVHQHEAHMHRGEAETDLHLARGGHVGNVRERLPRGMRPPAERRHPPIGVAEHPPRMARVAPEAEPSAQQYGGPEGYGVKPSDEPDGPPDAALEGAYRHGGRARRERR